MGAGLVSIIFTTFSAAMGLFFAPKKGNSALLRIVSLWVLPAAIAFTLPDKLMGLSLIAVIMAIVSYGNNTRRVCIYLGAFLAIPAYYSAQIPFPGINYLIDIDYAKLVTLVVLGPVFISALFKRKSMQLHTVERLLLFFVILTGVMSLRDLPFTSMLRSLFDQFLLVYVPYVAISRTIDTQEKVRNALKALFSGVVILAVIGFISAVVDWNYYISLAEARNHKVHSEHRNGFVRVYGTLSTTLLAYIMGVGVACAMFIRSRREQPAYVFLGIVVLLAFVAFVTGSRGGWLAAMLVPSLVMLLNKLSNAGRRMMTTSMALVLLAGMILISQDGATFDDKFGTFSYRADLLRTSFGQIAERPLFGAADIYELERFQHLLQGEGIIDLVNAYLQIALFYGLSGLALFVGAHLLPFNRALKLLGELDKRIKQGADLSAEKRIICILAASQLGFLAMITTTSAVSYTWNVGYMILAVLVAQLRVVQSLLANPTAQNIDETVPDAEVNAEAPALQGPKPYGARFVRQP